MTPQHVEKYVVKSIVSCKAAVIGPSKTLLILRRSQSHPQKPGEWDLIGGLWEKDANFSDSLIREAQEEAGIDLKQIKIADVLHFDKNTNDQSVYISLLYTAKTTSEDVKLSFEHDSFRWVTRHELDEYPLRPHWRKTAEAAFERFVD